MRTQSFLGCKLYILNRSLKWTQQQALNRFNTLLPYHSQGHGCAYQIWAESSSLPSFTSSHFHQSLLSVHHRSPLLLRPAGYSSHHTRESLKEHTDPFHPSVLHSLLLVGVPHPKIVLIMMMLCFGLLPTLSWCSPLPNTELFENYSLSGGYDWIVPFIPQDLFQDLRNFPLFHSKSQDPFWYQN